MFTMLHYKYKLKSTEKITLEVKNVVVGYVGNQLHSFTCKVDFSVDFVVQHGKHVNLWYETKVKSWQQRDRCITKLVSSSLRHLSPLHRMETAA
jgi:hypothetical protein